MIAALFVMFQIIVTWGVLFAVFSGVGLFLFRLLDDHALTAERVFNVFWLGWAVIVMALQLWHLFAPVNGHALLALTIWGLSGVVLFRSSLCALFVGARTQRWLWLILAALVLWIANLAAAPLRTYDAGLYHLSAIRWISSYPIVPGIGNLHDRLGFNSSYFVFQAVLDVGVWHHRAHHIASGLLLLVAATEIAFTFYKVITKKILLSYDLMRILFLAPIAYLCFFHASTTSPDIPMFLVGFLIGVRLCRSTLSPDRSTLLQDVALVMALSAVGMTIKFSFAAMGFLASLIALGVWISCEANAGSVNWQRIVAPLTLSLLITVSWMIRNVISTGYPLYPAPIAPFDVDWRVTTDSLTNLNEWIKGWARKPNGRPKEVLANWDWLNGWVTDTLTQHRFEVTLPMVLFLIALAIWLIRHRVKGPSAARFTLFLLPGLGMLLFWFLVAPEPRYAGATFWYLGAGSLAVSMQFLNSSAARSPLPILLLSLMITASILPRGGMLVQPGPDGGFYQIPKVALKQVTADSGLILYAPAKGDQCWDTHLMCVPYPDRRLKLIVVGDRGKGFAIAK